MERKKEGWVPFRTKPVLFYFILKSHKGNTPNNSSSYGTFHRDMAGTIYSTGTSQDPCQNPETPNAGGVGEKGEEGRSRTCFTKTVERREGRRKMGRGIGKSSELKLKAVLMWRIWYYLDLI